jgi:hypothetical protein
MPQLWAGRMRKDAADARAYGCTGLMGIHWRTRVLGPNVSALAQAAWTQSGWPEPVMRIAGADGGRVDVHDHVVVAGTTDGPVYQTLLTGLRSYCLPVPNGPYTLVLKFWEPVHGEKGKRVFTVKVQGRPAIENLDIFAEAGKGKALDKTVGIGVTDGWIAIEFVPQVGEPCLAGLQANGPYGGRKINCGGPAYKDFAEDLRPERTAGRYLPVADFYKDWARQSFGAEAGEKAGELFTRIDGLLPRPSNWIEGPGRVFPDSRALDEIRKDYAYVEEMERLRPLVKGPGNLERFDYWLNQFRFMRAAGKVDGLLARQKEAMEKLGKPTDAPAKKQFARETLLPIRVQIVRAVAEAHRHLLSTVTNASELGTIANWEQHNLPVVLTKPGETLAQALGEPLPPEAVPSREYTGLPRIIVPAVRTAVDRGEGLKLKILVLDKQPQAPVVCWRILGSGEFTKLTATHKARAVYEASLPAPKDDIEYYVEAETSAGSLHWPVTAPQLCQTVIVMD